MAQTDDSRLERQLRLQLSSGAATSPGYGCRHATLNEGVGSSRQLIAYAGGGGVAVEGRHLKLIGSLKFLVAAVASGN